MGTVEIEVDGERHRVPAAASVAAALGHLGVHAVRLTAPGGRPRGVFCGMGSCRDCVVVVDDVAGVPSCLTPVAAGMRVRTDVGSVAP